MINDEEMYPFYKFTKRFIEKAEACCKKDHSHEPLLIDFKKAIEIFDSLGRSYAERYEKEKQDARNTSDK